MTKVGVESTFDEILLLRRLSEDDELAFQAIYERYHALIHRTANRFLQSATLADDVVQEVFSSVWQHRKKMVEVVNLDAYIKTVAKNQVYSLLRELSYEQKKKAAYINTAEQSIDNSDFAIIDDQNERLLEQIINSLPVRQKEVFSLSRHEGLSHDHIAEKLNISQGTVKNHMVRALQTIKLRLSSYIETGLLLLIFNQF